MHVESSGRWTQGPLRRGHSPLPPAVGWSESPAMVAASWPHRCVLTLSCGFLGGVPPRAGSGWVVGLTDRLGGHSDLFAEPFKSWDGGKSVWRGVGRISQHAAFCTPLVNVWRNRGREQSRPAAVSLTQDVGELGPQGAGTSEAPVDFSCHSVPCVRCCPPGTPRDLCDSEETQAQEMTVFCERPVRLGEETTV